MGSIQGSTMIFGVPGNRGTFLFPRRAHLLTTCQRQAVVSLPLVGLVHSPMGSFALCGERQEIRQTSFPARKTPLLAEVQQRHFS